MPVQTVAELKNKLGILRDLKLTTYEKRDEFVKSLEGKKEKVEEKIILALASDGKWYVHAVDGRGRTVDWEQVREESVLYRFIQHYQANLVGYLRNEEQKLAFEKEEQEREQVEKDKFEARPLPARNEEADRVVDSIALELLGWSLKYLDFGDQGALLGALDITNKSRLLSEQIANHSLSDPKDIYARLGRIINDIGILRSREDFGFDSEDGIIPSIVRTYLDTKLRSDRDKEARGMTHDVITYEGLTNLARRDVLFVITQLKNVIQNALRIRKQVGYSEPLALEQHTRLLKIAAELDQEWDRLARSLDGLDKLFAKERLTDHLTKPKTELLVELRDACQDFCPVTDEDVDAIVKAAWFRFMYDGYSQGNDAQVVDVGTVSGANASGHGLEYGYKDKGGSSINLASAPLFARVLRNNLTNRHIGLVAGKWQTTCGCFGKKFVVDTAPGALYDAVYALMEAINKVKNSYAQSWQVTLQDVSDLQKAFNAFYDTSTRAPLRLADVLGVVARTPVELPRLCQQQLSFVMFFDATQNESKNNLTHQLIAEGKRMDARELRQNMGKVCDLEQFRAVQDLESLDLLSYHSEVVAAVTKWHQGLGALQGKIENFSGSVRALLANPAVERVLDAQDKEKLSLNHDNLQITLFKVKLWAASYGLLEEKEMRALFAAQADVLLTEEFGLFAQAVNEASMVGSELNRTVDGAKQNAQCKELWPTFKEQSSAIANKVEEVFGGGLLAIQLLPAVQRLGAILQKIDDKTEAQAFGTFMQFASMVQINQNSFTGRIGSGSAAEEGGAAAVTGNNKLTFLFLINSLKLIKAGWSTGNDKITTMNWFRKEAAAELGRIKTDLQGLIDQKRAFQNWAAYVVPELVAPVSAAFEKVEGVLEKQVALVEQIQAFVQNNAAALPDAMTGFAGMDMSIPSRITMSVESLTQVNQCMQLIVNTLTSMSSPSFGLGGGGPGAVGSGSGTARLARRGGPDMFAASSVDGAGAASRVAGGDLLPPPDLHAGRV